MGSSWGQSRIEVLALRDEILQGIGTGRSIRSIYQELKTEERVTTTYQAFFNNVKKLLRQPTSASVIGASPSPPSRTVAVSATSDSADRQSSFGLDHAKPDSELF